MSLQSLFGGSPAQAATTGTLPAPAPPPTVTPPAPSDGGGGGNFFSNALHSIGSTAWDLLATTRPGQLIRQLHEQRMQDDLLRAKALQDPGFLSYLYENPDAASRFHVQTAPVSGGWDFHQDPDTAARMAAISTYPVTDAAGNVIQDPTAQTFHPAARMLNAPALVETQPRAQLRLLGAQAAQEEQKAAQEQASARMLGGFGGGGGGGGGAGGYAQPEIDLGPGGPTFKFKPRGIKTVEELPPGAGGGGGGGAPPVAGPAPGGPPAGVPPVAPPPGQPAPGTPHPHYPQGAAVDPERLRIARERTGGGAPPAAPPAEGAPPAAAPAPGPPAPETAGKPPPPAPGPPSTTPGAGPAPAGAPAGGYPEFPKQPTQVLGSDGNWWQVKQKPISEHGRALLDAAGDAKNPDRTKAADMITQAGGNPDKAIEQIQGAESLANDQVQRRAGRAESEKAGLQSSQEVHAGIKRIRDFLSDPRFDAGVKDYLPPVARGDITAPGTVALNALKWKWQQEWDTSGEIQYFQQLTNQIIPMIRVMAISSKGNRITLPEIDLFGKQWRDAANGSMSQTRAQQFKRTVLQNLDLIEKENPLEGGK